MSRAYRVRQAEASARVEGGDSLALSLCLLDILDPEAMRALLREELLGAGWVPDAEGRPSAAIEDATATLDGDEVLDLDDHPADSGRIFEDAWASHARQAEPLERALLPLGAADTGAHLRDFELEGHR